MKTIMPVEITKKRKLSLNFEKKGDETFLKVGDKSISILEIYNQIKSADKFRGALIYSSEGSGDTKKIANYSACRNDVGFSRVPRWQQSCNFYSLPKALKFQKVIHRGA